MNPYALALRDAAYNLFDSLGTLEDLGPELANTVANVYYRYALASGNVDNLALALGMAPPTTQSAHGDLMTEVGVIMAQQEYIDEMVQRMRLARDKDAKAAEYLRVLALDTFKYRIANAMKKSAIRRAVERRLMRANEIAGLYERMRVFVSAAEC